MIGRTLSHYEITAKLGEGGMGEVWRATDTSLNRDVALKVLPEEMAADPERLERFKREAQAIAALNHPNIVTIHSVEEADGVNLLTMELVEGKSMDQILPAGGFELDRFFALAIQIADALAGAHEKGIVHRDLKPANVMVTDDGWVKVLDFGLAKLAETGDEAEETQLMTQAGMVLGTVSYMSPEGVQGQPVDHRSDIFSLGSLLYEMATGERPFRGDNPASVMSAVLKHQPSLVTEVKADLPNHLGRIVRRCLEKQPQRRYQSAREIQLELEGLEKELAAAEQRPVRQAVLPVSTAASSSANRALRGVLLLAGVVGALAIGAFVAGLFPQRSNPPELTQLTFERGYIHSARFAPDGETVLYGGAFTGQPVRLFSTQKDARASRPLDHPGVDSADIVGVSQKSELALLLDRRHIGSWLQVGTLARTSLSGGSPRPILDTVYGADISPDGKSFAVVVGDANEQRLEYPIGTVLFRSFGGWISHPRISPDGSQVAILEHPRWKDDRGYVVLIDRDGESVRVDSRLRDGLQGLAWSPSGEEVWFTSYGRGGALWRATLGREPVVHLRAPSNIRIEDVADSGALLLISEIQENEIAGRLAGAEREGVHSWLGSLILGGLSDDGTVIAATKVFIWVDGEYMASFASSDGRPPVDLAPGIAVGLTADGRYVLHQTQSRDMDRLTLFPTGPGKPRVFDLAGLTPETGGQNAVTSSLDGKRFAFVGAQGDSGRRTWILDVEGGAPRAISPEGSDVALISPDGTTVAVKELDGEIRLYPAEGGERREVPGVTTNEIPVAWSRAGDRLLVWAQKFPASVESLDLESGRRQLVHKIEVADPTGVLYGNLFMTTDGRYYICRYRRVLSRLYLVHGEA